MSFCYQLYALIFALRKEVFFIRLIDRIVIHCSATRVTQDFTAEQVKTAHIARKFRTWGYHYYIRKDGTINPMRPVDQMGAHATGYNAASIAICYEGGLDVNGKAVDTRTIAQKKAMLELLQKLTDQFNILYLDGHRDLSPDLDNDGTVEPHEWIKMCPCFDVHAEFSSYLSTVVIRPGK